MADVPLQQGLAYEPMRNIRIHGRRTILHAASYGQGRLTIHREPMRIYSQVFYRRCKHKHWIDWLSQWSYRCRQTLQCQCSAAATMSSG